MASNLIINTNPFLGSNIQSISGTVAAGTNLTLVNNVTTPLNIASLNINVVPTPATSIFLLGNTTITLTSTAAAIGASTPFILEIVRTISGQTSSTVVGSTSINLTGMTVTANTPVKFPITVQALDVPNISNSVCTIGASTSISYQLQLSVATAGVDTLSASIAEGDFYSLTAIQLINQNKVSKI